MDRPYLERKTHLNDEEIEQSGSENSGILCDRRCRYHKKKNPLEKKSCAASQCSSPQLDVGAAAVTSDLNRPHTLRSLFLSHSAHQVFAFCDVSASNPKLSDPWWIPPESSQCSGSDHTVLIRIRSGWTLPDDILARRWSTSPPPPGPHTLPPALFHLPLLGSLFFFYCPTHTHTPLTSSKSWFFF